MRLAAFALFLFACGSDTSQFQSTGTASAASNVGVGLIAVRTDDGTIVRSCSATLVDSAHALTSSACVDGVDAKTLSITFADTTSLKDWIPVAGTHALSDAVVTVALGAAPGIQPMPVNHDPPAAGQVGQTGELIAYGQTGDADYRNSAAGVITEVDDATLTVKSSGSSTDEGGPFLLEGLVVGVGGTTSDGTTFTFLRTDQLALSQ